MTGRGILAIWNDRDPAVAAEYETWYVDQHLPQRLGIAGFHFGRRYEAVAAERRFFTYYETDTPSVFSGDTYLEQLNNPTPETTRMMKHWQRMSRTVCRLERAYGKFTGAYAVTVVLDAEDPSGEVTDAFAALMSGKGLAGAIRSQLWVAETGDTGVATRESKLRGGDDMITAALVLDAQREGDARILSASVSDALASLESRLCLGVYRLLCELRA